MKKLTTGQRVAILAAIIIAVGGIVSTLIQIYHNREKPEIEKGVTLKFSGWYPWGDLSAVPSGNTVTLKGKVNTGGYVNEHLNTNMKNKTVILKIKNATASNFSEDRMLKITVNKNDQLIRPVGIDLIQGEYISSECKSIEFDLPNDFDGKLGFVFFQANLKNLKITMYSR